MDNKQVICNFFRYGYNEHNYEEVQKLLDSKYYDHSPAGARNPEDAIGILHIVENTFDNIQIKICDLIEEDDLVAGRFLFSGIHIEEYMGIQPTFKQIEWEFLEFFRIKKGMITESWGYWPDIEIKNKLLASSNT